MSGDGQIAASVLCSQHDVHARYGGVVPELAARRHIETVDTITAEALRKAGMTWTDIQAVAVTQGPGLAGALLVGLSFGKSLAYALRVPLIGVNHLEGHIASAWMDQPDFPTPCVVLVVSGGHTHLYLVQSDGTMQLLGKTLDDAAGEAFDKAAKILGLGFPGGPAIDRLARTGNATAIAFPRPYLKPGSLDFSFSGLKTALLYDWRDRGQSTQQGMIADVAASYQEAIVDVLVEKAFRAVRRHHVRALAVVGGVSANSRLRTMLAARAAATGIRLAVPSITLCTDNAAMIAAAGQRAYREGRLAAWDLEASADLPLPTEADSPSLRSRTSGTRRA
ncbi:MAG: tRNA (adenosine(37)-N6)-threonylcarbamoyltransferase complex transferase subunit TsaD [Nitrospiraceae bacterium]|nr:tRNA (adenosine(37)-N6)-threonylcarbamoyltransferase complex transferase subunit TsaD [Nitrospiraceae bacterium]MSR24410.1 tRNA (adenosine(37)-N6)-threonylcarbamoyltransferase complex transferase subunit TsaD [Nitrospiraceae bacterium]